MRRGLFSLEVDGTGVVFFDLGMFFADVEVGGAVARQAHFCAFQFPAKGVEGGATGEVTHDDVAFSVQFESARALEVDVKVAAVHVRLNDGLSFGGNGSPAFVEATEDDAAVSFSDEGGEGRGEYF